MEDGEKIKYRNFAVNFASNGVVKFFWINRHFGISTKKEFFPKCWGRITWFLKENEPIPASFCLFSSFQHDTNQYIFIKAYMVCLGLKPGLAVW